MFGEYVGECELTHVDVLFPSIFVIFRYELKADEDLVRSTIKVRTDSTYCLRVDTASMNFIFFIKGHSSLSGVLLEFPFFSIFSQ
jgi:hypothetical protein